MHRSLSHDFGLLLQGSRRGRGTVGCRDNRPADSGGLNVEVGANWVEGVNGGKMNPIWPIVNSTLKLRNFRSDFDYLPQNVYKEEYVMSETEY